MTGSIARLGESRAFRGYPAAVAVSELLFLSGVRPADALGFDDLPPEAQVGRPGFPLVEEAEEAVVGSTISAKEIASSLSS